MAGSRASGFDVVWNCDTVVEPDRPRHMMFDGPTTLAMMAAETSRIRVGTLVSSLYFREPLSVAKAAMTLDHLTPWPVRGRARGRRPVRGRRRGRGRWSPAEQVARFAEFVELMDLLLRQEVTTYDGTYYRCTPRRRSRCRSSSRGPRLRSRPMARRCLALRRGTPTPGVRGVATGWTPRTTSIAPRPALRPLRRHLAGLGRDPQRSATRSSASRR